MNAIMDFIYSYRLDEIFKKMHILVFRARTPHVSRARIERMIKVYLAGREGSTLRSYQSSFAKLAKLCRELKLSLFKLDEWARCQLWTECRWLEMSASGIKGLSAVISLVREVLGQPDDTSGRERVMKRGVIKASNLSKKKSKRKGATIGMVLGLVKEARRTGSKEDYRVAMMAVFCYFGVRRLADVREVRVMDVNRVEEHLEVFIRKHKTDTEGSGEYFTMVRKGKRFHIHDFLREYKARLNIHGRDALFPAELRKKGKGKSVTYNVMYNSLEAMKARMDLDKSITWHSFRIGSASRGTSLGVSRNVVKRAGLWRSEAVDLYCREENAGVILSHALVNDDE